MVFCSDAGRECCVILHTQSGETSLILKQPLSARWLASGKISEILSPRFSVLKKGFFWERQVRSVRATFVFFTSLKNEDDVKELTSSLLLLRLTGQRGTRLSLRN